MMRLNVFHVCLALICSAAPAYAQEEHPVQLALLNPVQLFPEGDAVRGIRLSLLYGKKPSNLNPQLCNVCEVFAREYQGGAEVGGADPPVVRRQIGGSDRAPDRPDSAAHARSSAPSPGPRATKGSVAANRARRANAR